MSDVQNIVYINVKEVSDPLSTEEENQGKALAEDGKKVVYVLGLKDDLVTDKVNVLVFISDGRKEEKKVYSIIY